MHSRHVRKALGITAVPLLNPWFKGNSDTGTSGGCPLSIYRERGRGPARGQTLNAMPDHRALRQSIRSRRRSLPPAEARRCAWQLDRVARHDRLILNSQRIAAYLAADGEIDPYPLIESLWSLGKTVYLPVLVPFTRNRLWFARYDPDTRLVTNRYGIPEPRQQLLTRPAALDLVLTPLVAFDLAGHRIGMGGGFYDRSFAFLLERRHWRKPVLLGIAYAFQQQRSITAERWDVPLNAIATEAGVHRVTR